MANDLILNIYGQEAWHTDAQIVGSPIALQALKEAINKAISRGYAEVPDKEPQNGKDALFASDGEGYLLKIVCLGDWDDKRWPLHKPEYSIEWIGGKNGS